MHSEFSIFSFLTILFIFKLIDIFSAGVTVSAFILVELFNLRDGHLKYFSNFLLQS